VPPATSRAPRSRSRPRGDRSTSSKDCGWSGFSLRHHSPALSGGPFDRSQDPAVNDVPERAENDHAEQYLDDRAGATRIEHEEADAAGADDDLGRDERAPAIAEPVAQAGHDVGKRARQHHFPEHADARGAE